MIEDELVDCYTVEIKAIENYIDEKNESTWKFIVLYKIIDDDVVEITPSTEFKKVIEIVSYREYEDMLDAIQDAYGVIELIGFQFVGDKPQEVEVLRYNPVDNDYVADYVLYDGMDFYPPETKSENETEKQGD